MSAVSPLNWNAPIVDSKGRPTPAFLQQWNQQAAVNALIPTLSTPAAVSAVLDVLGGVNNDYLQRQSGLWVPKTPPGDATKFLNGAAPGDWALVKDSDLSTSDVPDNNVSITKHGFAPKAPNDSTKFLDGTGAYSVPPTGGGSSHYATPGGPQADDGPLDATLGIMTKPMLAVTVDTLGFMMGSLTAATLYAGIYEVANQTSGVITAIRAVSASKTVTQTGPVYVEFPLLTPFVFAPPACYILAVTRTDATTTTSAHVYWCNGFMAASFPDAIASGSRDCRLASKAPAVSNTFSLSANSRLVTFRWS